MRFRVKDVMKTVLVSLGWLVALLIMSGILLLVFGNPDDPDANLYSVGFIFIPFFIMTMLAINKYLLRKNGLGWEALGFVPLKKNQILKLSWQVPLCWLFMLLAEIIFLIFFFGNSDNLPETQSSARLMEFTPLSFIMIFLSYAVFTPILEEIIFRGGILQALESKFNVPVSRWGSSVLFMIVHTFSPLIMPALLVAGLSFAYLYQKHRSIYAPIALHVFINGINVMAVNLVL